MSTAVDNRVVSMEFDNAKFEKNVSESLSTLKKLSSSLDSLDNVSTSGFDKISNSIKDMPFDRMADALDDINDRFSFLGQIGQQVISGLASEFSSLILNITNGIKSISIDQVSAGWGKYEEKTKSVATIMSATGESIDYVNSQLDRLMWFTDETSYNFSDMANNIGKFTATGANLEDSMIAMQGISNWAAVSGQNAQKASMAMYNLSQAMSLGSVKVQDWKSIELANMATLEFKETALSVAEAYGTITKVYEDESGKAYYAVGDAAAAASASVDDWFTAESMRDTLKDGWFTSDVLMKVLNVYGGFSNTLGDLSDATGAFSSELLPILDKVADGTMTVDEVYEQFGDSLTEAGWDVEKLSSVLGELTATDYYTQLGRKAYEAAQEAKTFGDAIDAVKDAVSSSWMRVFEDLFGNYEEVKGFWTDIANDLVNIFTGPSEALHELLSGANTGTSLGTEALHNLFTETNGVVSTVDNLLSVIGNGALTKGTSGADALFDTINSSLLQTDTYWEYVTKAMNAAGISTSELATEYGDLGTAIYSTKGTLDSTMDTIASATGQTHDEIVKDLVSVANKTKTATEVYNEHKEALEAANITAEDFTSTIDYLASDSFTMWIAKHKDLFSAMEENSKTNLYEAIADEMRSTGFEIDSLIEKYGSLEKAIRSTESLDWLWENKASFSNIFEKLGFSTGADGLTDNVKATVQAAHTVEESMYAANQIAKEVAWGWWGEGDEMVKNLEEAGYNAEYMQELADRWVKSNIWDPHARLYYWPDDRFGEEMQADPDKVWKQQEEAVVATTNEVENLQNAVDSLDFYNINLKDFLQGTFVNTLSSIVNFLEAIKLGISDISVPITSDDLRDVASRFYVISEYIRGISEKSVESGSTLRSLVEIIGRIVRVVVDVGRGIATFITPAFQLFVLITKPIAFLIRSLASIGRGIDEVTGKVSPIYKILSSISSIFSTVISLASKAIDGVTSIFSIGESISSVLGDGIFGTIITSIVSSFESLATAVQSSDNIVDAISTIFESVKTLGSTMLTTLSQINFSSILLIILEGIAAVAGLIGIAIWSLGTFIVDKFKAMFVWLSNNLQNLTAGDIFNKIWETFSNIFNNFRDKLELNYDSIISKISSVTGISEDKFHEFLDPIYDWIMNLNLETLKETIRSKFGIFGDIFNFIKNAIVSFTTSLSKFFEDWKVFGFLTALKMQTVEGYGFEPLVKIRQFIEGIFESISNLDIVQKISGFFSDIISPIKDKFSSIDLSGMFTSVGGFFSGLWEMLSSITLDDIINIFKNIASKLKNLVKWVLSVSATIAVVVKIFSFGKLTRSLAHLTNGFAYLQKSKGDREKMEGIATIIESVGSLLLKIALAFVVMIGAIWVAGKLAESEDFGKGIAVVIGIAIFLVSLIAAVKLIDVAVNGLGKKLFDVETDGTMEGIGNAFLSLAESIILMIIAIKLIEWLKVGDGENTVKIVLTMLGIIAALSLLCVAAKHSGIDKDAGSAFVKLAASVLIMAIALNAVNLFGFDWNGLVLLGLIAALSAIVWFLGDDDNIKKANKGAGLLELLALDILAFGIVIRIIDDIGDMMSTVLVLAAAVFAMVAAVAALSFLDKKGLNILKSTGILLLLALDLVAIAHAFKLIDDLSGMGETVAVIAQALIVLVAAVALLGVLNKFSIAGFKAIGELVLLAVALAAIGVAFKAVGDLSGMGNTVAVIAQALIVLVAAVAVLGALKVTALIGVGILTAIALVVVLFGYFSKYTAEGITALGEACEPFGQGLQSLAGIDMDTLSSGLGKLAMTLITLGLATAVLGATSGTKLASMSDGLLSFCNDLDELSVGLDKLANLGKDGDNDYNVDTALDNLGTIFGKLAGSTLFACITDFLNGDNDDALSKAASSLVEFNSHIEEIQNVLKSLTGSGFGDVDAAMDKLSSLVDGLYEAQSGAYGDDFSNLYAMSDNIVKFGTNLSAVESAINGLSSLSTGENANSISNAMDVLKMLIGKKDAAFQDDGSGLVDLLNSVGSTDFTKLEDMSTGLASFEKVGPAIEVLKGLNGLNVTESLKPITEIFGENGVITKILTNDNDYTQLTTMSETLASFVESFTKMPEISDTIIDDLIARSDEFMDAGKKMLDSYIEGMTPDTASSVEENGSETTKLVTIILDEFNSRLEDWKNAGSDAAAAFVAGITEDSDSIIESINTIFSGVSSSGLTIGGVDTSGLTGSGTSGGLSTVLQSFLGDLNVSDLLGGKSITEFLGLDSLTGSIDVTSMFGGLTNGSFDFSSMLNLGSLTNSIDVESMFNSTTSEGGTFDFSSMLNLDSLNSSINVEDMFDTTTSTGESFDFSSYLNLDSVKGSIKVEEMFSDLSSNGKYDLSAIIDASSLKGIIDPVSLFDGLEKDDDILSEPIESAVESGVETIDSSENSIKNAMSSILENGIVDAIKDFAQTFKKELLKLMKQGRNAIKSEDEKRSWKSTGKDLIKKLSEGMISHSETLNGDVKEILGNAWTAAYNTYPAWVKIGEYISLGLATGILNQGPTVQKAIDAVCGGAEDEAMETIKAASPSKVFMRIGEYISQGMAIGILNDEDTVTSASETIADSAIATATTAESLISQILESSDNQPTIRPVLDLSDVRQQAQSIGSILGTTTLSTNSIASKASSLSTSIDMAKAKIQNAQMANATVSLDAESLQAILANSSKPIQVNTNIAYEGSLAQLATVLHPYIKAESNRIGPSFVNSSRR